MKKIVFMFLSVWLMTIVFGDGFYIVSEGNMKALREYLESPSSFDSRTITLYNGKQMDFLDGILLIDGTKDRYEKEEIDFVRAVIEDLPSPMSWERSKAWRRSIKKEANDWEKMPPGTLIARYSNNGFTYNDKMVAVFDKFMDGVVYVFYQNNLTYKSQSDERGIRYKGLTREEYADFYAVSNQGADLQEQLKTIMLVEDELKGDSEKSGTNWLSLIPGNERAVGASVYVDGEYKGILTENEMLIKDIKKGLCKVEIDGEKIERKSLEIEFETDWMSLSREIHAETATKKVELITIPSMVSVEVNGIPQTQKTPVTLEVKIDEQNKITLKKDGYKTKEIVVKEEEKGIKRELHVALEKNKAPEMPRKIGSGIEEIGYKTKLKWMGADEEGDAITYEVWFAKAGEELWKIAETTETSYRLPDLESEQEYHWKVVAKDNWNRTEGIIWKFKTIRKDLLPILVEAYICDWEGHRKEVFNTEDTGIAVKYKFLYFKTKHQVNFKLFKPNGEMFIVWENELEAAENGILDKGIGYDFSLEKNLSVKNTFEENPGGWKIEIYLDDMYIDSLNFSFEEKDLVNETAEPEKDQVIEDEPVKKTCIIDTDPTNAKIYIDGEYKGITPLTKEFSEGVYQIELRKKDYKTKIEELTITDLKETTDTPEIIKIDLEKEVKVRLPLLTDSFMVDWGGVRKDEFDETTSGIAFTIRFRNWTGKHTVYSKWYAPDNSLCYDKELTRHEYDETDTMNTKRWIGFNFQRGGHQDILSRMNENPGKWKIEIYIDDQFLKTLYFTFTKTTSESADNDLIKTEMVKIEGGTFQMGQKNGFTYNAPLHNVTLTYDYWMGKYEITNEVFLSYLNESHISGYGTLNGREHIEMDEDFSEIGNKQAKFYLKKGLAKAPVVGITWWGAIGYCNWLSDKEGLARAYDPEGNLLDKNGMTTADITKVEGYRLPTEAEWEYAAQGGKEGKGYSFSGGSDVFSVAWYKENSGLAKHEAGQRKENELGLFDMSGNVWEWCQDWYSEDYYQKCDKNNPVNVTVASYRVLRGGSWDKDSYSCFVSFRYIRSPKARTKDIGFRVVRTDMRKERD